MFDQFVDKTPEQAASLMLAHFKGDRRATEVEAWKFWAKMAGGEPGRRPNADSPNAKYFIYVINAVLEKRETPPVASSIKPAGAYAAPFLSKTAA